MKLTFYIVLFFTICNITYINSQVDTIRAAAIPYSQDSISISNYYSRLSDSIPNVRDTSISLEDLLSKEKIETEITYNAKDSSLVDLLEKKIHLYGGAELEYQSIKINANYMVLDFENNLIQAYRKYDTLNKIDPPTSFKEGDNTFTFDELQYNIKTKKGFIHTAVSKQGEFNLVGTYTKYIGAGIDSTGLKLDDIVYNKKMIITTCDHFPPHFGIRADKIKFVPNKLAVLSSAQLELAGVPTPLFLPFGFFPLIKGKSSGVIIPNGYDYNEALGLGFKGFGWYFPISNNLDLRLTGDIYTRGTVRTYLRSNYKKIYGYDGFVNLEFSNNTADNPLDGKRVTNRTFSINVSHQQSQKSHPYRRLGGSINLSTNRHNQRVREDAQNRLASQYNSNFSFSHDMPGTPFRFNADFRHSQNVQTQVMDITLPNINLRMNTIFPLKSKNSTKETWKDRVALSYDSELKNFVRTTDTTLFTSQTLKDLQTGMRHRAVLSTNFRMLKYINVSPNINYNETWLTKQFRQTFDPNSVIVDTISNEPLLVDTLRFGPPIQEFYSKLGTHRMLNTGVSINTQLFFTRQRNKGFLRGIRHTAKPFVSFVYSPENKQKYERIVDTDIRSEFNMPRTYSIFNNGPFGTLTGSEQQMALTYGVTNIVEAKYWSKKDSSAKIIRLFDNLSINGNYNMAADSFGWSNVNISGNTRLFKGLTNFIFQSILSPYVFDEDDRRTNVTVWSQKRVLPEFRVFGGQFLTSFSLGQLSDLLAGNKPSPATTSGSVQNKREISDLVKSLQISHSFSFEYRRIKGVDTLLISNNSLSLSGSIPLSKNWNFNIGNIAYDFKNKSIVYPYFTFARDLHCWQMSLSWSPSLNVYSFFITAKSSALNFLKYDYQQNNPNVIINGR